MLRVALHNQLRETLGLRARFEADDFIVGMSAKRSGITGLEIRCRFSEAYWFRADIPNEPSESDKYSGTAYDIQGVVAPGEITATESFRVSNWKELHQHVVDWTSRVEDELLARPLARELSDHQTQIDDLLKAVGELEDRLFEDGEIVELRQRLDELEARLADAQRASADSKKTIESRIESLHSDIDRLKQDLESLKKPGWVRSFVVRLWKWSRDPANQAVLKSGTDVVKGLLKGE